MRIKSEIREIFKVGNHSIHITDTLEEAIEIANLVFNENSLDLLNRGNPAQNVNLNRMIRNFKRTILEKGLQLDQFIIDSSAVMGLYGIRECRDLDYLSLEEIGHDEEESLGDCHDDYLKYYDISKDALILNPSNYLVYQGVKFITLEVLQKFKKNRREEKDLYDNVLITKFNKKIVTATEKKLLKTIKWRRMKRNLRYKGLELLRKVHLYDIVKK